MLELGGETVKENVLDELLNSIQDELENQHESNSTSSDERSLNEQGNVSIENPHNEDVANYDRRPRSASGRWAAIDYPHFEAWLLRSFSDDIGKAQLRMEGLSDSISSFYYYI